LKLKSLKTFRGNNSETLAFAGRNTFTLNRRSTIPAKQITPAGILMIHFTKSQAGKHEKGAMMMTYF
jgi:hypothetical protein